MTNEQILKLAKSCGIIPNKYKICISWEEELLKFARSMYDEGYDDGAFENSEPSWLG